MLCVLGVVALAGGCATTGGPAAESTGAPVGERTEVRRATPPNAGMMVKGQAGQVNDAARRIFGEGEGNGPAGTDASGAQDGGAKRPSDALLAAKGVLVGLVGGGAIDELVASPPQPLTEIGPIASSRTVWLGVGWEASEGVHRMLEYGGLVADFRRQQLTIRGRLMIPTAQPGQLASSIRRFCRGDDPNASVRDQCPALTNVAVESESNHVLTEIRVAAVQKQSISKPNSVSTSHERFGFEGPTTAWQAFLNHDGAGVYATYEGIRRLTVLLELTDAYRALLDIHGAHAEKLSGRGLASAQRYLSLSAGDASRYVDVSLLHTAPGRETSANVVDIVSTPTRSPGQDDSKVDRSTPRDSETEREEITAPIADVSGSFLKGHWFVSPSTTGIDASVSHPLEATDRSLRDVAFLLRRSGSIGSVSILASLLEAPWSFVQGLNPSPSKEVTRRAAVSVDLGMFRAGESMPAVDLIGGIALAWPADSAPETPVERLPEQRMGIDLTYQWTESERRKILKIGINTDVATAFSGPNEEAPERRFVSFDKDRVLDVLGGDEPIPRYERIVEGLDRWIPGDSQHVRYERWSDQQVTRLTFGGDQRHSPERRAVDRAFLPAPSSVAYLRCRARHAQITKQAFQAVEAATPQGQWKLLNRGREASQKVTSSCAQSLDDRHRDGFQAAIASWWDWAAAWMWAGHRFRWAAHFRSEACKMRASEECSSQSAQHSLAGWVHPPVMDLRLVSDLPDASDRPWIVKLNRHGSGQVHRTDGDAFTQGGQRFDQPEGMTAPWRPGSDRSNSSPSSEDDPPEQNSSKTESSTDPADVRVVADGLTPAGALGRVLERAGETGARPVLSTVSTLSVPPNDPPMPGTSPVPPSYAAPELTADRFGGEFSPRNVERLDPRARIWIRPDGIRIHDVSADGIRSEATSNGDSGTEKVEPDVTLPLRRDVGNINEVLERGRSETDADGDRGDAERLRQIMRLYPLIKLNRTITSTTGTGSFHQLLIFRVHPEVPVQAVTSVMSAALVAREGAPFKTRRRFDAADIATERRGHRNMVKYLVGGWKLQFDTEGR